MFEQYGNKENCVPKKLSFINGQFFLGRANERHYTGRFSLDKKIYVFDEYDGDFTQGGNFALIKVKL